MPRSRARAGRHRSVQPSPLMVAWASVVLVCGLVAYVVDSLTVVIMCAVIGVCAVVIVGCALFAPQRASVVPGRPVHTPNSRKPGERTSTGGARAEGGTVPSGRPCGCRAGNRCPGVGKCRCKRCQHLARAAKSKADGTPTAAAPRWSASDDGSEAWLRSPEARRIERRIVREERRKQRRERM